jgi:hypothetical protein
LREASCPAPVGDLPCDLGKEPTTLGMRETLADSTERGRVGWWVLTHIAEMLYIAKLRYVYQRRGFP